MIRYYAGLDIGGTKCAVTLGRYTSPRGGMKILNKTQFETRRHSVPEMLRLLAEALAGYAQTFTLSGIGISCGGPLDSARGVILGPPNLPGWDQVEIVRYYEERFHLPVYLQNDANACAVAEWKYGAGRGCNNLIFLTFGTGLGAGLILGGRLYTGENDMAGETGHIRLSEDGPTGYGKRGSFEGFCSGGGIARLARAGLARGGGERLLREAGNEEAITAKLVGDLAQEGDPYCADIYAQSGHMLGKGLAVLIDILNPGRIIIGSIFTRSRELLWRYAQAEIEREALAPGAGVCEVLPSALGENLGDMAALSVATGRF